MGLTKEQTENALEFFSVANRRSGDGDIEKCREIQNTILPEVAQSCDHYGMDVPDWLAPYRYSRKSRSVIASEPRIPKGERGGGRWTKQTDSDNFKRWFGASKVVDAQGKPLVVYHGTQSPGFGTFEHRSRAGIKNLFGPGHYFTDDPDVASAYAETKVLGRSGENGGVYPVYLSIQNPFDIDKDHSEGRAVKSAGHREGDIPLPTMTKDQIAKFADAAKTADLPLTKLQRQKLVNYTDFKAGQQWEYYNTRSFLNGLRTIKFGGKVDPEAIFQKLVEHAGYDGITHIGGKLLGKDSGVKHRVYIAFHPEQIKSAIGNNGDYDPINPDITKSRIGIPRFVALMRRYFIKKAGHSVDGEARKPKGGAGGGQWTTDKPNAMGHPPNDPAVLALAKQMKIAIPPTSWALKHHTEPNAIYTFSWRNALGQRGQHYSEYGQKKREEKKLETIKKLKANLPTLRRQYRHDLRRPDAEKLRVAAAVVAIIDATTMRNGNEGFAEQNGTYGASSLLKNHVQIRGSKITFTFIGKASKPHVIVMNDKLVADALDHLMHLPGEKLMQYHSNEKGAVATYDAEDTNDYLRPFGTTAKGFRTFHATRMAKELLDEQGPPKDEQDAAKKVKEVVEQVSKLLGNTPAICKAAYISPQVLIDYQKSATTTTNLAKSTRTIAARTDGGASPMNEDGYKPGELEFFAYIEELQKRIDRGELDTSKGYAYLEDNGTTKWYGAIPMKNKARAVDPRTLNGDVDADDANIAK